ncbi:hypothetical protein [Amycolatopsis magusensis]|uniref:hypothetical protein n=1 Tax=Amycolatopsis magusensis TaxID=882444 RepID=UPI0037AA662D
MLVFRGERIGTGIDGEPLVLPIGPVILRMDWTTFTARLSRTPPATGGWSIERAARPRCTAPA